MHINKSTEKAIHDMFRSKAESKIYLYLLTKNGAQSTNIIKATKLHPSTVRELLVRMHTRDIIYRQKLKNEQVGKNPYIYFAVPPAILLKRYIEDLESKLTKIANLSNDSSVSATSVKIQIKEVSK